MNVKDTRSAVFDPEGWDVVVVGSGAGGLSAALTARLNGLKVIILEKEPRFGGTTARAGGGFWIPENKFQAGEGISDSREQAVDYLKYSAANHYDSGRVEAFLDNGPRMIEFFEAKTALKFYLAPAYSDYHPHAKGALEGGRTVFPLPYDGRSLGSDLKRLAPPLPEMTILGMHVGSGRELLHFFNLTRSLTSLMFVTRKFVRHVSQVIRYGHGTHLSNGAALVARFVESTNHLGIPLVTSCSVGELVVEEDRVVGVRATYDGETTELRARRGVVLACGGFPHNRARRKQLYRHTPSGQEHFSPAYEANTGDGLAMAERVGAGLIDDYPNAAAWTPVSLPPRPNGKPGVFPHFVDRAKPGLIAVTREGRRFTNEANSYHDFGQAMLKACEGSGDVHVYLIADHRAFRRYGMGAARPFPIPYQKHLRSAYLKRGNTLRELAAAIDIDGEQLERTVAEFNDGAAVGKDSKFGRGDNAYNRYFGDAGNKPNPCLAPLVNSPFYAMKLLMGDLGSFVGLPTDRYSRVLNQTGHVIPGLYAVGNDAASVMGGAYPGGGSTLGPAMTFGYIAGNHLASTAKASSNRAPLA
jgi:succinate dehydrogenase/fumarate reductase flavoprotein subunit